jgi:hypothetical protein
MTMNNHQLQAFVYDKVESAYRARDQDEKIEQKRKALDDYLARAIRDPSELSFAQELVNSLCGAYIGEGDDKESSARAEDRKRMALDSGRAGDGVLSEFFAKYPAPQRV